MRPEFTFAFSCSRRRGGHTFASVLPKGPRSLWLESPQLRQLVMPREEAWQPPRSHAGHKHSAGSLLQPSSLRGGNALSYRTRRKIQGLAHLGQSEWTSYSVAQSPSPQLLPQRSLAPRCPNLESLGSTPTQGSWPTFGKGCIF